MKQITVIFRMIAVCAVLALFAGCRGGTLADPGDNNGNGNNYDARSKPKKLSNNATYQQWVAKTDEIIAYCKAHPGAINTSMKEELETLMSFNPWAYSDWNNADRQEAVDGLNKWIDLLE
jgi:hypothetical protein